MNKKLLNILGICALGLSSSGTFAQYCTPVHGGSGCGSGDNLNDVQIFNSGINHLGTGCSANAYGDFTGTPSLTGNLEATVTYNFEITHTFSSSQWIKIWIDFDNNNVFDPSEEVFASTTGSAGGLTIGSFSIPAAASPTTTRMRISNRFAALPDGPCNIGGTFGETHDYTVNILPPPTCPSPLNIAAQTVAITDATFSWTSQGTETEWNLEYGPTGFVPGSGAGTIVNTTNNPETITGLTPASQYDVYVQAVCAPGDESTWTGPAPIFTNCVVTQAPFTEDFDGPTWIGGTGAANTGDAIDQCWDRTPTQSTSALFWGTRSTPTGNQTTTGPQSDFTGGNFMFIETSYGPSGSEALLFSPFIDLSTLTLPELSFAYHMYGATIGELRIEISEDNGATWDQIFALQGQQQASGNDPWIEEEISLAAYVGETVQLKFIGVKGTSTSGDLAIDLVQILETPSCPRPSNFQALGTSATEIDLTWIPGSNETNWTIEYGPVGFTPGVGIGTTINTTNNPETITGLTASTNYDFYILANCGPGDESTWRGPLSVSTPCATFTAPFSENFDGSTWVGGTGGANTGDAIDPCWVRTPTQSNSALFWGPRSTPTGNQSTTGPQADVSGTGNFMFIESSYGTAGSEALLFSPLIDLSALTVPQLNFSYHMFGATIGELKIEISDDFGVTWNQVYSIQGQQQTSGNDPWMQEEVSLAAYAGATIMVKFIGVKGTSFSGDLAIDEVSIIDEPSCTMPSDLNASNVLANSVELDWIAGSSETEWELEYEEAGFTQGTGDFQITTTNPYTLTGLIGNTTYEVYVRAICAPGDSSTWRGPIIFTTPCETYMAPFFEDFEDGVQPDCWDNITNNVPGTSVNTFWRFNSGVSNGAVNNGKAPGTYAWTNGSVPNPDSILLITPFIDLSALSTPALGFEWFSNNTNTPGNNNTMTVNLFDGSNWTNLDTLSGDSTEWRYEFYDLSAWAGQTIRISFNVDQSIMPSPFHNDILLDDVEVNDCTPAPGIDGNEDICRLDEEINLFDYITPGVIGGKWEFPSNAALLTNDSILLISALPSGTFDALYITTGICTSDTTIATINIFPPSSAGQNGTIEACRNQPVDLFAGLNGNIDLGGDWIDPQGNTLPNPQPISSNIPGNYNYNYIVSNGVCPADTQFVEVIVSATCDYLSVGESELGNIEVYPNPATDVIKIDNNSNAEALVIEVMDMNGRLVLSDANALFNNNHATISIESLETGVYTIRLSNKEGQRTFKVVKQ